MPEISDLIEKLKALQDRIPEMLEECAMSVANDGLAIAQDNIQTKGFGEIYKDTSYKSYREKKGHQTEFVDLTLSAKMWNGMQVSDPQHKGHVYYCLLENNTQEGANKMNWNYERYGDFIGKALKDERDVLTEVAIETIYNYIDKIGI